MIPSSRSYTAATRRAAGARDGPRTCSGAAARTCGAASTRRRPAVARPTRTASAARPRRCNRPRARPSPTIEPSTTRSSPVRPLLPTMIRSAPTSRATPRISAAGFADPRVHEEVDAIGDPLRARAPAATICVTASCTRVGVLDVDVLRRQRRKRRSADRSRTRCAAHATARASPPRSLDRALRARCG